MHKLFVFIFLLLFVGNNIVSGQVNAANTTPAVMPTFWWRCSDGDSLLNYNNATIIGDGDSLVFDSLPYAKDYTMVVVYKALDDNEANVWRMDYLDSVSVNTRGLSTERIISNGTAIQYAEQTSSTPIINTLRQTAPDSISQFNRLVLGGDTLQGRVMVAELMYFNRRLGNTMLRRVQSALAVRYGITLGPVDYLDRDGNKIWEYVDSGRYHHRVTGVGRDSTYSLYQLASRSEMDGSLLTIETDSLSEHAFLTVGDNNEPLVFVDGDDGVEILARQWKARAVNVNNNAFSLVFDIRNMPMPTDSIALLLDGNVILPTVVNVNNVRFDNVWFPSDTCIFTLARGSVLWQLAQGMSHRSKRQEGDMRQECRTSYSLFPNPTTGHYTLEVSGAKQVQVVIYNTNGSVVATYSDSEKEHYLFNGNLPSGNSYFATVTTESGSQTMKLVVK